MLVESEERGSPSFVFFDGPSFVRAIEKNKRGKDMKTFRTLELAIEFHEKVESLKLTGHMRDQLSRAASSVALNLAEGNGKPSEKEKKRFYQIAYASVKETQTILRLIKADDDIKALADRLGASAYKLVKARIVVL